MKIKSYIVDAFTEKLFSGNKAGVCLLEQSINEKSMFDIAKEFGYSETAFIVPVDSNIFSIRYFSPKMEIPLCGHATMASAKVLFNENEKLDHLIFKTHSGYTLEIMKNGESIEMYFPIHTIEKATISTEIKDAIGLQEVINCEYNKEHNILMVEISSSTTLEELNPDFETLKRIKTSINGVLATAISSRDNFDFEYRYFWPWSGSNEDPATGGVQSFLAKYWSDKLNKTTLKAHQSSERTGSMKVRITDDKTVIESNAVIFLKGTIDIKDEIVF